MEQIFDLEVYILYFCSGNFLLFRKIGNIKIEILKKIIIIFESIIGIFLVMIDGFNCINNG